MPTTDPAIARLALRRLARSLLNSREAPNPATTEEGIVAQLDADELADYEQVLAALDVVGMPQFATMGPDVIDLSAVGSVHEPHPRVRVAFSCSSATAAAALARVLNRHPDTYAEALAEQEEPF